MGAFFFVRSLLMFVNGEAPFAGNTKGWILTGFFFFDAWLLGECFRCFCCCCCCISVLLAVVRGKGGSSTYQHCNIAANQGGRPCKCLFT